MPRFNAKKKGSKWGRRIKKVAGYADKASKALALASKLARVVNVEVKHVDTSTGGNWITSDWTTGNIGSLMTIPQGTAQGQRSGDSVKAMSLNIKGVLATGNGAQFQRVLVVKGRNERGTAPTLASLFQTTGSQAVMHSLRNPQYDTIYKVIAQKTVFLPSNSGDFESRRFFNIHLRLGHHICFNPGASTTETGGLWIVFLSDSNGTNAPNIQYTSRLAFVDN